MQRVEKLWIESKGHPATEAQAGKQITDVRSPGEL